MQYERRWLAVIALGLSLFLSALDATIVALALPPIAQHFQLSDSLASAVILSYAIPLTVLILPAGDLVSRFRTLPTFLISIVGFGLGSLTCGLASNFALLVVGRVVQGCFGAVIGIQGLAVTTAVVSPGERGRALGLVGALAPLGGVALYYLLPFDMSVVQRIAPAHAGVILLCVPLGMGIMGILGGYLTDRYGAQLFMLTGSGLLLVGLITLTLIVRFPITELDLAWRLLLSGIGIGLFTSPNQTRLMSVGERETIGAASTLANLVSRLGSICGPLGVGLVWTFLASFSAQMIVGMLLIDGCAVLNLLFAWVSLQGRARGVSPEKEPETASEGRANAEAS